MKRLSLLLLCALFTFACSDKQTTTNDTPVADPVLTVTSAMNTWFESEGGEGTITYTIENQQKGLTLRAESSDTWISNITVGESVTFVVAENTSYEERRGTITLQYGNQSKQVTIKQHSCCDVVYNAYTTSGSVYFGGNGLYNYLLVLSTNGMGDGGYLQAYSEYYYFDLYSEIPASGNSAVIPNGTYRLAQGAKLKDGDIDPTYSNLTVTDNSNYEEIPFVEAEVVVTDNNIVAVVEFANGERHLITYSGSLDIGANGGGSGGDDYSNGFSTLTADHTFNIENGVFVGALVGDLLGNGYDTCQVFMYEYLDYQTGEERGDQFQIDLQLPRGTTDICGTYTEGTTAGHFIPGAAEDMGDGQYMSVNSWYNTAGYLDFAPLISGSVKIEMDAYGMYTFTIDTVDDKGYAIKGVFKGYGEVIEW